MKSITKCLFVLLVCFCNTLIAQVEVIEVTPKVEVTQAVFLGKTQAVRDLVLTGSDVSLKKKEASRYKKKPANFPNRRIGKSKAIHLDLEHQGPDPLRQINSSGSAMGIVIEPKVNVFGVGNFGSPHDPTGDIGQDHYLQAVNVTLVGVFDKDGNLVTQFPMSDLWSNLGVGSAGDPIILYDDAEDRWIITEFPSANAILVAVSDTDDPLGSYNAYMFNTPNFPDYPKYGIGVNEIVVTTNEQGAGTLIQYFLDKDALYSGAANVTMQRVTLPGSNNTEAGFFVSTPIDVDGQVMPVDDRSMVCLLNDSSWGAVAQDAIDIYRFDVDFANPGNTTSELVRITTTPFDGFPCSSQTGGFACTPQQGGGGLDAIPEVIMNVPKYRNLVTHESIVMSFITDVTDGQNLSGIRWVELRKVAGGDWELYQEGTYAPDDGLDRYMCSIAIDGGGNIGLGYNVSSPTSFVGVRFTGRTEDAPLGEMNVDEFIVAEGTNAINSGGRFGDYAQMSVDPTDESTFWFTTEYAATNGVRTRIVAFEINRDSFDIAASDILSPVSVGLFTAAETVTMEVTNSGLNPISNYTVGFELDNVVIDQFVMPGPLQPDESINVDFPTTVDMSAMGQYEFKAYVNAVEDTRVVNDTTTQTVNHVFNRDMAVVMEPGFETCVADATINFTMTNNGAETLNTATVNITVGGNTNSLPFNGNLGFGQSQAINWPITLTPGVNNVQVEIADINGVGNLDDNAGDNIASTTFDWSEDLIEVTLQILTDNFPAETSWELVNQNGTVVAEGGNYTQTATLESEAVCVSMDDCYTFTIFDAYGDGICCGFGQGNYALVNADGQVIFSSTGEFGGQETQEFCGDMVICNLAVSVDIVDDTGAGDGSIMITASGGSAPYFFSVDGGDNFQSSPLFENLPAGPYTVVVVDSDGFCEVEENVMVDMTVAVQELDGVPFEFIVNPNPNNGYFEISFEMENMTAPQLRLEVIDASGKIIQARKIGRFNNIYRTAVSVVDYPSGNYYVRLLDEDRSLAIEKVVKL